MARCLRCGAGPLGNCWHYGCETPRETCPLSATPPSVASDALVPSLSHDDACRLSRAFNEVAHLGTNQDYRINEWLKALITARVPA